MANDDPERTDLGVNQESPSVDGVSNPTSGGDNLRLSNTQRSNRIRLDNERARVNKKDRPDPFFQQFQNLLSVAESTDSLLS
jgi:hypothetical protein